MMQSLGFGDDMTIVFCHENNGRHYENDISSLYFNQALEFPKNLVIEITDPEFLSQMGTKSNFLNQLNNPHLKVYSRNSLVQEIPVKQSDMVLDEKGVFTIDFNLTESIKSELKNYFHTMDHSFQHIDEFIIIDAFQSNVSPEYLHIDMMVKRKAKIYRHYY